MSKLEEYDYALCSCPCGQGTINRHGASMDHGYGGGSYWDAIECPKCDAVWRLEGSSLVDKACEAEYNRLRGDHEATYRPLSVMASGIVDRYFAARNFRTRTAEWDELRRLGMYSDTVGKYRHTRQTKSIGSVARSTSDPEWLLSQCESDEERRRLQDLLKRREEAGQAAEEAQKKIIRRPWKPA